MHVHCTGYIVWMSNMSLHYSKQVNINKRFHITFVNVIILYKSNVRIGKITKHIGKLFWKRHVIASTTDMLTEAIAILESLVWLSGYKTLGKTSAVHRVYW